MHTVQHGSATTDVPHPRQLAKQAVAQNGKTEARGSRARQNLRTLRPIPSLQPSVPHVTKPLAAREAVVWLTAGDNVNEEVAFEDQYSG